MAKERGKSTMRLRFILGALATLFAVTAQAATVNLSWVNPSSYEDGTALAASAITRTRVEYGSCVGAAFGVKAGEFIATGAASTATSPNLAPGTYCFRAYTTASGIESDPSNVAQKVLVQPQPNPPVLTVVTAFNGADYAPVFGITAAGNRSTVLAGLAPKGTPCTNTPAPFGTYLGKLYFEIDRAKVVRTIGASLPMRVAAPCA